MFLWSTSGYSFDARWWLILGILSPRDLEYIKGRFEKELIKKIPVVLLESDQCKFCSTVDQLMNELVSISNGKIEYMTNKLQDMHKELLGVERGPILLIGEKAEIRYTGAPIGEEGWAFLEALLLVSHRRHMFKDYEEKLSSMTNRVKIETIVTPTCPLCPQAVIMAHNIAVASNGRVISDVVEAYEFPEIADKYYVTAVPTVVLSVNGNYNGRVFSVGVPNSKALLRAVIRLGTGEDTS